MEIQLHYCERTIGVEVPDSVDVTVLKPKKMKPVYSVAFSMKEAFESIGRYQPNVLPATNWCNCCPG